MTMLQQLNKIGSRIRNLEDVLMELTWFKEFLGVSYSAATKTKTCKLVLKSNNPIHFSQLVILRKQIQDRLYHDLLTAVCVHIRKSMKSSKIHGFQV